MRKTRYRYIYYDLRWKELSLVLLQGQVGLIISIFFSYFFHPFLFSHFYEQNLSFYEYMNKNIERKDTNFLITLRKKVLGSRQNDTNKKNKQIKIKKKLLKRDFTNDLSKNRFNITLKKNSDLPELNTEDFYFFICGG